MSRPDDTNSHNAGTAQAGHPTGWPRPQEQHARDPITGRPLATQPAEAWQGSQAYHYPGQAGHTPAAPYPPAGTAQHYQPAAPAAQPQPGLRGGAVQPDYAPQFARYSGGEAAPIQPGYAADPYQPPRAPAAQPEGWPPAASQHAQAYVPAPGHAGTESHWPGDRLPYQNLTTGEPRSYDPNAYATPAQAYPDPHAGYPPQAYQGGFQEAGYQQGAPGQFGQGQPSHSQSSHGHYPAEQGYDPHTGQPYAPGAFGQAEAYQGYAPHDGAFDAGQPIASVCHGVEIPARADRVRGRRMATVPKCKFDLEVCGGIFVDEPCVIDGNLVSGRTYHDHGAYVGPWIRLLLAERAKRMAATDRKTTG